MARTLSRRDRERQEHIRYVLDVAETLFAEKGFVKVTMKQIAQRAEFALGTIYSFFQGKRQLYGRLVEEKVEQFMAHVTGQMALGETPKVQVEKFIEAKLDFFHQNLPFLRLYLAETHGPHFRSEEVLAEKLRKEYQALLKQLAGVFEQGISKGVFARLERESLARALDGLTNALAFSWLDASPPDTPQREIELVKEIFLHGVLKRR